MRGGLDDLDAEEHLSMKIWNLAGVLIGDFTMVDLPHAGQHVGMSVGDGSDVGTSLQLGIVTFLCRCREHRSGQVQLHEFGGTHHEKQVKISFVLGPVQRKKKPTP